MESKIATAETEAQIKTGRYMRSEIGGATSLWLITVTFYPNTQFWMARIQPPTMALGRPYPITDYVFKGMTPWTK